VPLCVAGGFLLGQLPELIRRRLPRSRVPVLVGNAWYAVGPAALFVALGEPDATLAVPGVLLAVLLAQFATDFAASVSREWFALRIRPHDLVRPLLWVFLIDALLAPVAFAATIASTRDEAAVLLPLSLLGLIWFFARERKGRLDQALELSSAYRGTAYLLGDVVEADDEYTGTHSREVVDLVLAVCDHLRVDGRTRNKAEFAALLHDVGKIKIPAEIINKPAALTPEERTIINTHTIEGEQLLLRVGGLLGEVGTIVRSCHEDFDGSGYPDGLAGEQIPLVARIVACCDAYNAMTTTRPYRKARSSAEALAELERCRGKQFDPEVVDAVRHVLQAQ
jgi:HD-GYP domain-containing protein (c-di-GMP phosphodiesterase class II)